MKTRHVLLAVVIVIAAPSQAWAKRLSPPVMDPVEHEGVSYSAPNDEGERAIVKAHDLRTRRTRPGETGRERRQLTNLA